MFKSKLKNNTKYCLTIINGITNKLIEGTNLLKKRYINNTTTSLLIWIWLKDSIWNKNKLTFYGWSIGPNMMRILRLKKGSTLKFNNHQGHFTQLMSCSLLTKSSNINRKIINGMKW